jgi:GNAT superfamily N-acetyltransferase
MPAIASIRRCTDNERDTVLEIINEAAKVYRRVIPEDLWRDPYMPRAELDQEISAGVTFWGYQQGSRLAGVMGIQSVRDVALIRHAYVRSEHQRRGIGAALLHHLCQLSTQRILVGTWADATWAIEFYRRHGFTPLDARTAAPLMKSYWSIPQRQLEASVVLVFAGILA